jgi:hypothetical protein
MTMSPEVQQEYDTALLAATLKHGTVVATRGRWGWQDFDAECHLGRMGALPGEPYTPCRLVPAAGEGVAEDEWIEFEGTFYEGDKTHHGVIVNHVSCACGQLTDRSVRWEARVQEVAEAVFEMAFGPLRNS